MAKSRYSDLQNDRQNYLDRARKCAKLTIPSLIPETEDQEDKDSTTEYPYQSLGASGVSNLASRLQLSLFPPNTPYFRFRVAEAIEQELAKMDIDTEAERRLELTRGLLRAEQSVQKDFEKSTLRPSLTELFKHLIVAGNACLADQGDEGMRVFGLHQYVVVRSPSGRVLEAVIKERISKMAVPEGMGDQEATQAEDDPELYTHIRWNSENETWHIYQEIYGEQVPDSIMENVKPDDFGYIFARMVKVDGADYGRSFVEENYGDLYTLEQDTKSAVELGQIYSMLLLLLKPNSQMDETDVTEASNGDVLVGEPEDLTSWQPGVFGNLEAIRQRIADSENRLARSFLLVSSVQRQAERVTAEEIRLMASQLEETFGGIYTTLAQEIMLPLVKVRISSLKKRQVFPDLDEELVDLTIVVGMEALGRGQDLNRLRGWIADVKSLAEVDQGVLGNVNFNDLLKRITESHGLSDAELLIPPAQAAEEAVAAQTDQLTQEALPGVIQEVTKGALNNG